MTSEEICNAFYRHCHRGGKYAMLWTPNGGDGTKKFSSYVPTSQKLWPPVKWLDGNTYFGVSPSNVAKDQYHANRNEDIAAVNVLYREYDGKDFTTPAPSDIAIQYMMLRNNPERFHVTDDVLMKEAIGNAQSAEFLLDRSWYKELALRHILALPDALRPTVVIDSGGGYQCYHFLDEPFMIESPADLDTIASIQKRWVHMDAMADPGVHDIRRVFRAVFAVGDTYVSVNHKPKYGPDFPVVRFMWAEFDRLYRLQDLAAMLPEPEPEPEVVREPRMPRQYLGEQATKDSVIEAYNSSQKIREELEHWGYFKGKRMSRQGDKDSKGVQIYDDSNTSLHWSTHDQLYSKHAHTPFSVRCIYEFQGNVGRAVRAVALEMGMAYDQQPLVLPEDITAEQRGEIGIQFLMGGR